MQKVAGPLTICVKIWNDHKSNNLDTARKVCFFKLFAFENSEIDLLRRTSKVSSSSAMLEVALDWSRIENVIVVFWDLYQYRNNNSTHRKSNVYQYNKLQVNYMFEWTRTIDKAWMSEYQYDVTTLLGIKSSTALVTRTEDCGIGAEDSIGIHKFSVGAAAVGGWSSVKIFSRLITKFICSTFSEIFSFNKKGPSETIHIRKQNI